MSDHSRYEGLHGQLGALGALKRNIVRVLPHDCPAGSAAVLATLRHHGAVRLSRLADLHSVDISVASRHVSHAVGQGWVARTRDPEDGRSWSLDLTATGRGVLEEISARTTQLLADRLSGWTDEEIDQLTAVMVRLRETFAECRPTARAAVPA